MAPILLLGLWELGWWAERRDRRGRRYHQAEARAFELGRPLVVVGAPDSGPTGGYGCGDLTVDIAPGSACPRYLRADVTRPLPFEAASVVVFCSCVLEYVHDFPAAWAELDRVSGGELYLITVEPWTLTGMSYPGTRRSLR